MSTASGDRPATSGAHDPAGDSPTDPEAIKADIEATREQLGRTVDELTNRLDVPARAREQVARTKDTAVETYRESPPAVIGAGAALSGLVGLLLWGRRRARRRATPEGALRDVQRRQERQARRDRTAAAAHRAAAKKAARKAAKKARKRAVKNAAARSARTRARRAAQRRKR